MAEPKYKMSIGAVWGRVALSVAAGLLAICLYVNSHETLPDITPEQVFQQGLQGVQDRKLAEVRTALDQLAGNPEYVDQHRLLRGALRLLSNNPRAALQDFGKLSPDGPYRDPLLTLTAEALYRQGQLEEAQQCLELALADDADNVAALRWLATVYYDLGELEGTLNTLRNVSRIAPEDFRPHHMQGVIYRDYGQHEHAVAEFEQAVKLAKTVEMQAELRSLLASSQMSLKQFDAALKTLEESPKSALALSLQADCRWQLGQSDVAGKLLKEAETLGELPTSARRLQARILFEQNSLDAARQLLEPVIAVDPSDDEAEYLLAQVFRQQQDEGQYQRHQARAEHIKSLKNKLTELSGQAANEPGNAEVRDELANICGQLGLEQLASVWRTAAASCRRRQPPAVPAEETTK